jgi:hypothetical protein
VSDFLPSPLKNDNVKMQQRAASDVRVQAVFRMRAPLKAVETQLSLFSGLRGRFARVRFAFVGRTIGVPARGASNTLRT